MVIYWYTEVLIGSMNAILGMYWRFEGRIDCMLNWMMQVLIKGSNLLGHVISFEGIFMIQ